MLIHWVCGSFLLQALFLFSFGQSSFSPPLSSEGFPRIGGNT
uniref:Uncharacterized protein n=1 Tax=Siphoviridae sp. ctSOv1 TaxID=2827872 RepID=A0A8S5T1B6_9CAUD|nr:MAG TPA: hypothetical protein [Siphoviridae sp. ctSOv1]